MKEDKKWILLCDLLLDLIQSADNFSVSRAEKLGKLIDMVRGKDERR